MSVKSTKKKLKESKKRLEEIREFTKGLLENKGVKAICFVAVTKDAILNGVETPGGGASPRDLKRLVEGMGDIADALEELAEEKASKSVVDDEDGFDDEEESEDDYRAYKLRRKVTKALEEKGYVDKDGHPTKKALAKILPEILPEILLADEKPNEHELLNKLAGDILSDSELEFLKSRHEDWEDDDDED